VSTFPDHRLTGSDPSCFLTCCPSVLSQEIGLEERLQNDLLCVELGRKALTQSISELLSQLFTKL